MRRKTWILFVLLVHVSAVAEIVRAAPAPFDYGFLGGEFYEDEDSAFSTWNDIHFACHFFDAQDLQEALNEVSSPNRVLVDLGRAWQARTPSCDLSGPWGDVGLFISRVQPLLATLHAYQERLLALWIFDEPDVRHGGPRDANLRAAIDYLHQAVPGVPVFVNWFTPENNRRLPNADWYSTTKGADPSALAGLGKPMFLWWFNNEADPHPVIVNRRWHNMVSHFYRTTPPPIVALGWCCDSIDSFDGVFNDNSIELTALVANLGQMRRDTGTVARAAYASRRNGGWYLFRREPDGTLSYTDIIQYPFYRQLPIGGTSPFYPAVSQDLRGTRILRVGEDLRLYVAWITLDNVWTTWRQLPGQTDAKPDVLRFRAVTWQAIRGLDGAVYVKRDRIDRHWLNLDGRATSAPFFKVVNGNLRVAVFGTDGRVYAREWNGIGWGPWDIEP
jgi:hypothetical protein